MSNAVAGTEVALLHEFELVIPKKAPMPKKRDSSTQIAYKLTSRQSRVKRGRL